MKWKFVSLSIKDFQRYLGVRSRNTAAKYYAQYLADADKKPFAKLTVYDVVLLDDLSLDEVLKRLNF